MAIVLSPKRPSVMEEPFEPGTGMIATPPDAIDVLRWIDPTLPGSVAALVREALADGHSWAATMNDEWNAQPFLADGEGLFLAFAAGHLVATAAIRADPYTGDHTTGHICYIYVRHVARRRGLAEHLLRVCLARGRDRWRVLRLHTDNPVAARLYEAYGFAPSRTERRATHVRVA